jgi:hypothetical protein
MFEAEVSTSASGLRDLFTNAAQAKLASLKITAGIPHMPGSVSGEADLVFNRKTGSLGIEYDHLMDSPIPKFNWSKEAVTDETNIAVGLSFTTSMKLNLVQVGALFGLWDGISMVFEGGDKANLPGGADQPRLGGGGAGIHHPTP